MGSNVCGNTVREDTWWYMNETYKSLCQKVDGEGTGIGEKLSERPPLPEREGTDIVSGATGRDGIELVQSGRTEHVEDEG